MIQAGSRTGWYTPTKAITRFLEAWRRGEARSPVTVDSLIAVQTPPSVAARALRTLEGLGLVSHWGQPSEELLRYREAASDADAQAIIADVVRRAYVDVFEAVGDPATASETDLLAAFSEFEPATQRDRMVGLFVGLCQFSGLVSSPRRTGRPPLSSTGGNGASSPPRGRRPTESRSVDLQSGSTVTLQVSGGLLGLSPDDLEFVFHLVRIIDSYKARAKTRAGP